MHSFATESFDEVELYSPELLNKAIKDWIESEDPQDATTMPELFIPLETVAPPPENDSPPVTTVDDDRISRKSNDGLPSPQKIAHFSSSTSHSSGIISTISMRPITCCFLEIPNKGSISLFCCACVLCIPCYHSDVYFPSHSCHLLCWEGAGSYYTNPSINSNITLSAKYALLLDCLCCICCGHYYCCQFDWIKDGTFQVDCCRCNNQLFNLHTAIYSGYTSIRNFIFEDENDR